MAFPVGTQLVVDRIYIRKGKSDHDSITFVLRKGGYPDKPKLSRRFWAKLGDVDYITCAWKEYTLRLDSTVHPLARLAAEAER